MTRYDDALARLVEDLLGTVRVPGRAGVAANQIGVSRAVFAYNVDGRLGYVVNPVLTETEGEQDGLEACLSLPGLSVVLSRAARATVTGTDLRGDPFTVSGQGELARCFQHEAGHLRGELYIDRLAASSRPRASTPS